MLFYNDKHRYVTYLEKMVKIYRFLANDEDILKLDLLLKFEDRGDKIYLQSLKNNDSFVIGDFCDIYEIIISIEYSNGVYDSLAEIKTEDILVIKEYILNNYKKLIGE